MTSTFTTSLKIEEMATGDQSGTWGDTTNTNYLLFEQAITGYLAKAMTDANQTLTNLDGALDEARNAVINATGLLTAARNMVVPTAAKLYLAKNSTTGGFAVTFKTAAGTGVTVPPGTIRWVYCDGTNVVDGMGGPLSPSANDAQALGFSGTAWSDLFLASGAVINWNAGDVTLTHSANALAFAGASSGYSFDAVVLPSANDAAPLGSATVSWSDLFLASGAVVNWNNGDATITHSANALAFAGASNGYSFDAIVTGIVRLGTYTATTSGTAIDFLSIPAGVKEINVNLVEVSVSGTSQMQLRIGDSGGIETSGYLGVSFLFVNGVAPAADASATAGFNLISNDAAYKLTGTLTLSLVDAATNLWVCSGSLAETVNGRQIDVNGRKALSATLDRVQLTTVGGSDTFDNGSMNISYAA